jgi:hypothetical protein
MNKFVIRYGVVALVSAMLGGCNDEAPQGNLRASVTVQLPAPKPYTSLEAPTPGFSQPIDGDSVPLMAAADPLEGNVE